MLTSIALEVLTNEAYSLEDTHYHQALAQYVCIIICHGLGCNIVDISNQLSFAKRGLATELRVFITPLTDTSKATDFI